MGKLFGPVEAFLLNVTASVSQSPIFVLGNQRSGTSIIASLLGIATRLSTQIDLKGICGPTQVRLTNGQLSFHSFVNRNRRDFSRQIIKEPSLTLFYDAIVDRFPSARFIFVARHPVQNSRSILDRLGIPGNLDDIFVPDWPEVTVDWERILNCTWLGLPTGSYIEMLAHRWEHLAGVYLNNADDMTLIRYEDFVRDKEQSIHNLASRLDLQLKCGISEHKDTQYQKKGNSSVEPLDFFGHRNLSKIIDICRPNMSRLEYTNGQ